MDKSEALERARLVEDGALPSGSVVIPLTGPDSITSPGDDRFDFEAHLERQHEFSVETFGPGFRPKGIIDHIRKELIEIEAEPYDLSEWIDVLILACDGALKSGHKPAEIVNALVAKQTRNENRSWPDWRTADPDKAIEHVREGEKTPTNGGYHYNRRMRALYRMQRPALAEHYKRISGWIGGAHDPATWDKHELVRAVLEVEFPS